jgi:hypothetical protein
MSVKVHESNRINFTCEDVLGDYVHVIIAIGPSVLVPKADDMAEFVHDNTEFVAILANRNRLRSIASSAHERAAPVHV